MVKRGAKIWFGANTLSLLAFPLTVLFLASCGNEHGPLQTQSASVANLIVTDSPLYDFGSHLVDAKADKTFTVTNIGLKDATAMTSGFSLSLNFSYAGGSYPGTDGTCGAELGAGRSCTLVVRFNPKYVGTFTDVVKVTYHNGSTAVTTSAPSLKAKATWDIPGAIDATLAPQGHLLSTFDGGDSQFKTVLAQDDGKWIGVGSAPVGGLSAFSVARYFPDGTLDSSFGVNGLALIPFASSVRAAAAALQFDGRIVLAGTVVSPAGVGFQVVRLLANGAPDPLFGTGGVASHFEPSGELTASAVQVLPDRKIIVAGTWAGSAKTNFAVARLESDGTLDLTFGTGGFSIIPIRAGNDTLFAMEFIGGNLVLGGASELSGDSDLALARLSPQGDLDSTFGTGGVALLDVGSNSFDVGRALKAQSDGKLLVAGSSTAVKSEMAIARFNSDGTLDATFGFGGKTLISLGSGEDVAHALLLQPDRKILLLGGSADDIGLVRLTASGVPDATFGNSGKVVSSFGSGRDTAYGAVLQSNGKVVVVGESFNGTTFAGFLARFWP